MSLIHVIYLIFSVSVMEVNAISTEDQTTKRLSFPSSVDDREDADDFVTIPVESLVNSSNNGKYLIPTLKKIGVYCITSVCPSIRPSNDFHSIFLRNYIIRISEILFQGLYKLAIPLSSMWYIFRCIP